MRALFFAAVVLGSTVFARASLAQPYGAPTSPGAPYAAATPAPPTLMLSAAVTIGGTVAKDPSYFIVGGTFDASYAIARRGSFELFGRGVLGVGSTIESDWSGSARRIGAGGEARLCTPSRYFCTFGDVDVGYQKLDLIESDGTLARAHRGMTFGARVGFDTGRRVRFRGALERAYQRHEAPRGGSFAFTFLTVGLALEL